MKQDKDIYPQCTAEPFIIEIDAGIDPDSFSVFGYKPAARTISGVLGVSLYKRFLCCVIQKRCLLESS